MQNGQDGAGSPQQTTLGTGSDPTALPQVQQIDMGTLIAEVQRLGRQSDAMQAEMAKAAAERSRFAPEVLARQLADLPSTLATALKHTAKTTKSLVDTRGLGKPLTFKDKETDFRMWARKTEAYVSSVFPCAREVLEPIVDDPAKSIDHDDLFSATIDVTDVRDIRDLDHQLHTCLMSLTDGEAFAIV